MKEKLFTRVFKETLDTFTHLLINSDHKILKLSQTGLKEILGKTNIDRSSFSFFFCFNLPCFEIDIIIFLFAMLWIWDLNLSLTLTLPNKPNISSKKMFVVMVPYLAKFWLFSFHSLLDKWSGMWGGFNLKSNKMAIL